MARGGALEDRIRGSTNGTVTLIEPNKTRFHRKDGRRIGPQNVGVFERRSDASAAKKLEQSKNHPFLGLKG